MGQLLLNHKQISKLMFKINFYIPYLFGCFLLMVFSCENNKRTNIKKEYWEDPTIIAENKEDAHATLIPYDTYQEALEGNRVLSKHYKSLNGDWWFNWVKRPADRPMSFYENDYDI